MGSSENENSSNQIGRCQRLLFGQKSPTCPKGTSSPSAHSANPLRTPDGFLCIFPWIAEALRQGNYIRRSAFVTGRTDGKADSPNQFVQIDAGNSSVLADIQQKKQGS